MTTYKRLSYFDQNTLDHPHAQAASAASKAPPKKQRIPQGFGLGVLLLAFSTQSYADTMLNGIASYTKLGKERFLAGLYLSESNADANSILGSQAPQKMEMRVTAKRLSSRTLAKLWIESMAINNSPQVLAEQANAMVRFSKLIKRTLRPGDQLIIHRKSVGETELSLNGLALGTIKQTGFFNTLLRSWLGTVPFSSSFKSQLLVAGSIDETLNNRYVSIIPDSERTQKLAGQISSSTASNSQASASNVSTQETSAPINTVRAETSQPAPEQPASNRQAQLLADEPPVLTQPIVAKPDISLTPEPSAEDTPPEESPETTALAPQTILDPDELEEEFDEEDDAGPDFTAEAILNRQLYHSKLVKWAYQYVKYPKRAIAREQEGSVQLELIVDRSGNLQELKLIEPSRYNTLNRAAQKAIEEAAPFPPMPETMEQTEFNFTLPIVFRLPK